ncbi:WAP, Kazal, immunoglobulin, Kunitz and NTR domain-containing protein [Anopheles marshallii]|uniref:WAP, Kazal, immunoglobulin, Kunitz and NTR domain-containing protein n=1 Tax=Anopheles marshallii TaxID=1521116 RepID=UPI00237BCF72|nr:WAP, Kazal, immunoglobulin, Kunitz and NTR domain-containing protein [Anopheles marshallii]
MAKFVVVALALALCVVVASAAGDECPLASKVASCSPTCHTDSDCTVIGGKCCVNACNRKSCVERSKLKQGNNKYSSSSGSGSYCGSTKCNSFEKCGTDPATKRQKCVRA